MYIIKNAFKCIGRSKGRNILIGVIVLVIAISSCLGLSIRQAAESAKAKAMESLSVTGTISFDRNAAMAQMTQGENSNGTFDRSSFSQNMSAASSMSLEDYEKYATAEAVDSFYYSMTVYVNGSTDFEPVTAESTETSSEETSSTNSSGNLNTSGKVPGGMGKDRVFGSNSDFSVVGYSNEAAMTSFINGTATITDGAVFSEGESSNECIITEELAIFNNLSVGDAIQVSNPNNEDELYTLTISGIYSDLSANENTFSMFGSTSADSANQILVSYATLQAITDSSENIAAQYDETVEEAPAALSGTLSGTYVFSTVEAYEAFESEVRALGLPDEYTVSSADVSSYENSLAPLDTLSTMAGYFLIVILAIGAIILVVLNIFNIRERKYEIGVLTAMGMKKWRVSVQFLTEIFVVTIFAIIIGVGIGAASSVPVTNALLQNQVESQTTQTQQVEQGFGRNDKFMEAGLVPEETSYITEVSSAMNFTVVLQMLLIGVLLTLISGAVSMLFVMRYDPLKILANRD